VQTRHRQSLPGYRPLILRGRLSRKKVAAAAFVIPQWAIELPAFAAVGLVNKPPGIVPAWMTPGWSSPPNAKYQTLSSVAPCIWSFGDLLRIFTRTGKYWATSEHLRDT